MRVQALKKKLPPPLVKFKPATKDDARSVLATLKSSGYRHGKAASFETYAIREGVIVWREKIP